MHINPFPDIYSTFVIQILAQIITTVGMVHMAANYYRRITDDPLWIKWLIAVMIFGMFWSICAAYFEMAVIWSEWDSLSGFVWVISVDR